MQKLPWWTARQTCIPQVISWSAVVSMYDASWKRSGNSSLEHPQGRKRDQKNLCHVPWKWRREEGIMEMWYRDARNGDSCRIPPNSRAKRTCSFLWCLIIIWAVIETILKNKRSYNFCFLSPLKHILYVRFDSISSTSFYGYFQPVHCTCCRNTLRIYWPFQ